MKIKKDDKVRVLAGKDKGAEGTVIRAFPQKDSVIVEHVNMVTRAEQPTPGNPQGGLTHKEAPIHVSNVALVCPKCGQATRVGINRVNGRKTRVCKKCGAEFD